MSGYPKERIQLGFAYHLDATLTPGVCRVDFTDSTGVSWSIAGPEVKGFYDAATNIGEVGYCQDRYSFTIRGGYRGCSVVLRDNYNPTFWRHYDFYQSLTSHFVSILKRALQWPYPVEPDDAAELTYWWRYP